MRNDNEIVYRQNMTRNEAVHILKAIAFPIAVFVLDYLRSTCLVSSEKN